MKKGLNVTLMTVAIAVMAFQAVAMAPVIGPVPSPIVGSDTGATAPTPFVYPDAFNIVNLATDDTTTSANIRWSYTYTGTEVYRINNVDRVTLSDTAIKNPATNQKINGSTTDPGDVDANSATVTIRNVKYRPIGGGSSSPSFGGIGDVVVVTLFASDGSTYSQKEALFYTDAGGTDRLSGGNWTPIMHQGGAGSWPTSGTNSFGFHSIIGTVTGTTSGGTAVCLEVPAAGDNFGMWTSQWGIIPIAKNTVYRIRATISRTSTTPETTPFFDLVVDNFSTTGTGLNLYGGDLMFLDNEGGANRPNTGSGSTVYQMYWAPACVQSAAFNAYADLWSPTQDTARNAELTFRVLDVASTAAITAGNDLGEICLTDLQIDSIPYSSLSFAPVWSPAAVSMSNFTFNAVFGATAVNDGSTINITPQGSGAGATGLEYATLRPGDATIDYGNLSTLADNYPIAWESSTLYAAVWQFSAPDSTSEAAPFDAIWVGMDVASNEIILLSYVTSQEGKCAMPKVAPAQDYVAFMYSQTMTASINPEFRTLRPRADFANVPGLLESANTGSVRVNGLSVYKVTTP